MVGGSVAGGIPNGGQHMMQSLRSAALLGVSPRATAIAQLLGVVVGALTLALTYPLLATHLGAGDRAPPLAAAWAASATAFAGGLGALPTSTLAAIVVAAALGVVLALIEGRRPRLAVSPTALGMGMLLSTWVVLPLLLGAAIARASARRWPDARVPVASGLIAGEAAVASLSALF